MVFGVPAWAAFAVAASLGVAAAACAAAVTFKRKAERADPLAEFRNEDGSLPDEVGFEEPTLRGSRFGVVGELWKTWRYLQKAERLAGKGYVRWYCIDDTFPRPRFVKPEEKGGGVREYEFDDGVYLFPEDAAKPQKETGMWTFIHQKHDPEPVNIVDYREEVATAEEWKEWADLAVTTERPSGGLFDALSDLSTSQMMAGGVAVTLVLAVVFQQMGGA
jgi:hypothetical protein